MKEVILMRYVFLKSGIEIRFNPMSMDFKSSFDERGYFVEDVELARGSKYVDVANFTFHMDEISCHWIE
jgi:hypothetical protein